MIATITSSAIEAYADWRAKRGDLLVGYVGGRLERPLPGHDGLSNGLTWGLPLAYTAP